MPKRPSSHHTTKILELNGFALKSRRGSHVKYRKGSLTVVVPMGRKELPVGTFASIVEQSGLTKKHFQGKSTK